MSKRQLRFFLPEEETDLQKCAGKEITLCLENNSIFVGTLHAFQPGKIVLKDNLLKDYTFSFHEIREIILEQKEIF